MLSLSVFLYLLASIGLIAMGAKYIWAVPPLDYHAEIMKAEKPSEEVLRILGALYKIMGGAFVSLGVMLIFLTLFGVWGDMLWAKFAILLGAVIAGSFATFVPRKVELATGVRTPWRIAPALISLTILGFITSIF